MTWARAAEVMFLSVKSTALWSRITPCCDRLQQTFLRSLTSESPPLKMLLAAPGILTTEDPLPPFANIPAKGVVGEPWSSVFGPPTKRAEKNKYSFLVQSARLSFLLLADRFPNRKAALR